MKFNLETVFAATGELRECGQCRLPYDCVCGIPDVEVSFSEKFDRAILEHLSPPKEAK